MNYLKGNYSGLNGTSSYFTTTNIVDWNTASLNVYDSPQNSWLKYKPPAGGITDSSGNGNGLTSYAGITNPLGKFGRSAYFDGAGVFLGAPISMKAGLTTFTVSMWVNTIEARTNATYWNNPHLFGDVSNGAASGDFGIITSSGNIGMWDGLNGDPSYISTTKINDGNWHHIVASNDGATIKLYSDGVYLSSIASGGALDNLPFFVGGLNNLGTGAAYYHQGFIDDLAFWNRALDINEINYLYNSGTGRSVDTNATFPSSSRSESYGLLGLWKMDENSWTSAIAPQGDPAINVGGVYPSHVPGADNWYAMEPCVIKDGNIYKMWYAGYSHVTALETVMYATSPDGLTWTKYDNSYPYSYYRAEITSDTNNIGGRLLRGSAGRGDTSDIERPWVIKDGNLYRMWYSGLGSDGKWRIYYAYSADGINWNKLDNTIPAASDTTGTNGRIPIGATAGRGDIAHVYFPTVIKDANGTYRMWYNGHDGTYVRLYEATSPDGLTWTKVDNTIPSASNTSSTNGRIPLGTSGADSYHTYAPAVLVDGNIYRMWYTGYENSGQKWRILEATSTDFNIWTKVNSDISNFFTTLPKKTIKLLFRPLTGVLK